MLISLFQTPSLSLQTLCRYRPGPNLLHCSRCRTGNRPSSLVLFFFAFKVIVPFASFLTITSAGIVMCTLSGLQEGGWGGRDYFHLHQQLEAKVNLSVWVSVLWRRPVWSIMLRLGLTGKACGWLFSGAPQLRVQTELQWVQAFAMCRSD